MTPCDKLETTPNVGPALVAASVIIVGAATSASRALRIHTPRRQTCIHFQDRQTGIHFQG